MILNRIGNKRRLAPLLLEYFPPHKVYIEPFFGAGGMFFNKPPAKLNLLNDNDKNVFNLFMVLQRDTDKLYDFFCSMPFDQNLYTWLKKNDFEKDYERAARFIYMSNFSYRGDIGSLRVPSTNSYKGKVQDAIKEAADFLRRLDVTFWNKDFKDFLKMIITSVPQNAGFVYADPPYVGTRDNYQTSFSIDDFKNLLGALKSAGYPFAISEQVNDSVIALAEEAGLYIHIIKTQFNIAKNKTDILITSYPHQNKLF